MDEALLLCYEQVTRIFLEKRLRKEFDIDSPVFINGTGSSYVKEDTSIDMREFCVLCSIPHDRHYLFRNLFIDYIWNTPSGKSNWYPIQDWQSNSLVKTLSIFLNHKCLNIIELFCVRS